MHSLGNDILSENTSYTNSTDNKNDDFSFIAGITNVIFVVVVELVLKELHYITKYILSCSITLAYSALGGEQIVVVCNLFLKSNDCSTTAPVKAS